MKDREKKIIEELSRVHIHGSSDPETLCTATFRDLELNDPKTLKKYQELQSELFMICRKRKDTWAM